MHRYQDTHWHNSYWYLLRFNVASGQKQTQSSGLPSNIQSQFYVKVHFTTVVWFSLVELFQGSYCPFFFFGECRSTFRFSKHQTKHWRAIPGANANFIGIIIISFDGNIILFQHFQFKVQFLSRCIICQLKSCFFSQKSLVLNPAYPQVSKHSNSSRSSHGVLTSHADF